MKSLFYLSLILIGTVLCDIPEFPPELNGIQDKFNEISGFHNLNESSPSLEELMNAAKKKCEKNGGVDAFERLMAAKDEIQRCIETNFNLTQIEAELSEKRKTGSMDDVFAKYCGKRAIVDSCIKNFTNSVEPCLENVEKSSLNLLLNVTDNLVDFGCYKDGDRLAMFLAEGGLECIKSKTDGLENCLNKTLYHLVPSNLSVTNLPLFVIDEESCDDYTNLQVCVIKVLETCSDHTPANLIDAIFKYVRRSTPCKNHKSATSLEKHQRIYRRNVNTQELNALQQAYDKLKQKYEPHCLQNGGPNASNDFREALVAVEKCQNMVQKKFMEKNEEIRGFSYSYMCREFQDGLRICLANLTSKMEACSSHQEKYVAKFGLQIYDSIFKFQCKDDARALKMLLGEQDVCTKTILSSTDVCIGRTKHIRDYAKEAVVTKTELCSDLKLLKNCFRDMAAQNCPNNNNVNDLVKGFSDSIYAPCSTCNTIANLILLFTLFVFGKLF